MQKGFAGIIVLVVVLILAGLAGAYYFGKTQTPKSQPQITATPAPLAKVDETASWKTYTNTVNNYSVKIPQDWVIDSHKGVFVSIPGEVTFTPPSEMNIQADNFRTKVAITVMSTQKVRYSLNTQEQFNEWLLMQPASDVRRLAKVENLKIDGLDAVKFISTTLPGDPTEPFFSIVAWFRKDGNNYYIEFGGKEQVVTKNIKTFDQILSTFKFLDTNEDAAGRYCGGFKEEFNQCPSGYQCDYDGDYPDSGGKCVKK